MYPESDEPSGPPRKSVLPVMLSIVSLGGFMLFLITISGGFFLWVLLGCFAVFGIGLMHYFLWGHSLDQRTEGEREEARKREEMEEDQW